MELSREEVTEIAQVAARKIIEELHRYPLTYEAPMTIEGGLAESMLEEGTAADWYRRRGMDARLQGDTETADLYEHIAKEEDQHYQEFQQRRESLLSLLVAS